MTDCILSVEIIESLTDGFESLGWTMFAFGVVFGLVAFPLFLQTFLFLFRRYVAKGEEFEYRGR